MKTALTLIAILALLAPSFSQTVVWSEDFEGDWTDNWSISSGTWEVGIPITAPGTVHGGINCAGTVLNGDYPANSSTTLERSTTLTIPKANKNPRLRFWHWFSFGSLDYSKVQIKASNSSVWHDLTNYTYYSSCGNIWTVEEIDLSKWADSTVNIGFYFYSHDNVGISGTDVSHGWYIDDLEIRTGTAVFNTTEGFENGYMDWSVERGTWEIGAPTFGPTAAHSGTNCAATNLASYYDPNVDTRLRSAWYTVPAVNKNPRLRFWHWFVFSSLDNGIVQIKTKKGTWKDLTTYNYYSSCGNIWTVEEIDLSKWADSTIQIAFYFHSQDNVGISGTDVSYGWYIDDLEIRTGTAVFNTTEGFENGYMDWSVERGTWEIGAPPFGPTAAHSGTNCAATNLTSYYDPNVDSRLRSAWYTVPAVNKNPRLRFWHWFVFSSLDNGIVQIKTKKGTWKDLTTYNYYSSCGNIWTVEEIDLSKWADSTIQIAFYFHSQDNVGISGTDVSYGWYIDDLEIRTGTAVFNTTEGFENGYMDWSVERGTWEIGAPTFGPTAAHSGTNCAATNLASYYDPNVDSRLRSAWYTVPAVNKNPRLRFWHWFVFSSLDNGIVQIKTKKGTWKDLTTYNYYSSCGNIWTVEEIDLSKWADSTIQIAFYFHSQDNVGISGTDVSYGWYIDDLEIRTGTAVFNTTEGFENGYMNWSVERGTWEIGAPTFGPTAAHSGTNCAATNLTSYYDPNVDSRLRSAWYTVPAVNKNPRLRFWHWFVFSSLDNGIVQIKTKKGTWKDLTTYNYYSSCGNIWTVEEIDLSKWADSTIQIAFYFHSQDNVGISGTDVSYGWYIDDLEIRTGTFCFDGEEDFESGYFTWAVDKGTWEIGKPISGPNAANSGKNCAATNLAGYYDPNVDSRLHTAWFKLPPLNPSISFWHWFEFNSLDYGQVLIKTEKSNWHSISDAFSNSSGNIWSPNTITLDDWADSTVQIAFNFHSVDNVGISGTDVSYGWYIDDITISGLGTEPPPAIPDPIVKSGGSAKVCPGDTRTYSTTEEEGVTYWWTVPEGAKIMSGQETNIITVNYIEDFIASDTLSVVKINCGGSSTPQYLIIKRNNPQIPSDIIGQSADVCAATSKLYSVDIVDGITYEWIPPPNATIASGQGTNIVTVDFSSSFKDGFLKVTANNACGSSGARKLHIYSVPQKPGAISGNPVVCSGDTAVDYSIAPVANATSYKWKAPEGSYLSDGVSTSTGSTLTTVATSVMVNFGIIDINSQITVKAINSCGSSAAKKLNLTSCEPRIAGTISGLSNIELYPNPTSGISVVKFMSVLNESCEIIVTDVIGKEIMQEKIAATEGVNHFALNLNSAASGIYLMKLKTSATEQVLRIIKQ